MARGQSFLKLSKIEYVGNWMLAADIRKFQFTDVTIFWIKNIKFLTNIRIEGANIFAVDVTIVCNLEKLNVCGERGNSAGLTDWSRNSS